mmetsp:Transcript_9146/g.20674  ORF Transcript_9146/g.20674 Transcript_9146/m.20674 type:complete len:80 (+) Transcript_9146:1430-1669(+)
MSRSSHQLIEQHNAKETERIKLLYFSLFFVSEYEHIECRKLLLPTNPTPNNPLLFVEYYMHNSTAAPEIKHVIHLQHCN